MYSIRNFVIHINLTFSSDNINWTISESELFKERGPTTVTINNGNFADISGFKKFTLHGQIIFNHCSFSYITEIYIFGSQYEPSPTIGKWSAESGRSLKTFQFDRSVKFSHCDIFASIYIHMNTSYHTDALSFISLQIDHCSVLKSHIIMDMLETFVLYMKMTSVNMFNVKLFSRHVTSNIVLLVENSTWVNKDKGFMDLFKILSVTIISSQLTGTCETCTLLIIKGQHMITLQAIQYFLKSIANASDVLHICTLSLIESNFKAQGSLQNKVNSNDVAIILNNSNLIIEGSVFFHPYLMFETQNLLIQCSKGKMAQRILGLSEVIYTCSAGCEGNLMYSLESGILIISEYVFMEGNSISDIAPETLKEQQAPSCHPCPLGAQCESDIKALPNYWGYLTSKQSVSMIRCPDGYCCQGNDTCQEIDSCNTGRTGTLCGTCDQSLTEALFTSKCVLAESCR